MGYDMSIRGVVPGEEEELARIDPLYQAAIAARDALPEEERGTRQKGEEFVWGGANANATDRYKAAQAEVMRLSEERDAAHRSYFRLNIWGMGRYRQLMEATGMGFWGTDPEWPKPEEYGIDRETSWLEDGEPEYEALDEGTRKKVDDYRDEVQRMKSFHGEERAGIPLHKFCSNDGWHVTAVECESALEVFGKYMMPAYATIASGDLTWQDALRFFRAGDEQERKIMLSKALDVHGQDRTVESPWWRMVGSNHPVLAELGEDTDLIEGLSEDYFLQWLKYLEDASRADGFEVY